MKFRTRTLDCVWKGFRFSGIFLSFFLFTISGSFAQNEELIELSWLGKQQPNLACGVSWGVPFDRGVATKSDQFILKTSNGDLAVQSWPMAYWPDGSIKWMGLAAVIPSDAGDKFRLLKNFDSRKFSGMVWESADTIIINTGVIACSIPKRGDRIIESVRVGGKLVAINGQLTCVAQNGPEKEIGEQPTKSAYYGQLDKVTVEQNGPVRTVLKIEGEHVSTDTGRAWLPFVVRLYFYKGQASVKMVHTVIYDGDQEVDFIRALGLTFDVPMRENIVNRHVRFAGDSAGTWGEPVQPMKGRFPFIYEGENVFKKQLQGESIGEREDYPERFQLLFDHLASWDDFRLTQNSPDAFQIEKRTNDQSAWIKANAGERSRGLVFAGDATGGFAIGMRDFWQSYPSELEVRNAKSDTAQLKAWFWSPNSNAMDMRHYDTIQWGHNLIASYEDVQPGHSLATGVARTSELMLYAYNAVPNSETIDQQADLLAKPALLTVSPEYLHKVPVFGIWSLPNTNTKGKAWLEKQLNQAVSFYQGQIEDRRWYGYWDYGDVMHGYDPDRHVWMYDVGGFAWDNTELMPNMWLWYSFLRTGREDIFRMAEAMTRHTGEVDVYHLGKFKGLGSRHNVRHWGCGAKEVRISQAALGRFYYYLTTDDRTGDLMQASVEASNSAIGELDPLRLILKEGDYPTHARVGPDWLALVGNWMTAWERTGDDRYRDRILAGVNSLSEMPYGMFSGEKAAMGYDPKTFKLYQLNKDDIGAAHLAVLMGGPEVAYELTPLLANSKWTKLWEQFCRLYAAPQDSVFKEFGVKTEFGKPGPWYARLAAYTAAKTGNKDYAQRAWDQFLEKYSRQKTNFKAYTVESPDVLNPVVEVKGVSTNHTAQWCLNAIQLLELVGDDMPDDFPQLNEEQ